MADIPNLDGAMALPRDTEGPVFGEPWEARAFAIVVRLFDEGHYTWPEWVDYLSAEVAAAKKLDPAQAPKYYEQWLAAAEKLVADKGLLSTGELAARKSELEAAQPARN